MIRKLEAIRAALPESVARDMRDPVGHDWLATYMEWKRIFARDCPKGFRVCFNYNQTGHMRDEFPQLASRAV